VQGGGNPPSCFCFNVEKTEEKIMSSDLSLPPEQYLVLKGKERRETIVLTDGATRYIAESYPEADPTAAVWVCSKNSVSGDVEKLEVLDGLKTPGANGSGLKALFGDA
jgi:hypothetical protein